MAIKRKGKLHGATDAMTMLSNASATPKYNNAGRTSHKTKPEKKRKNADAVRKSKERAKERRQQRNAERKKRKEDDEIKAKMAYSANAAPSYYMHDPFGEYDY